MTGASRFDLLESPLQGTNLIEASAGTGKTFTIAGLFLRLILEKKCSVDEVLVVTFTQAATEELRARIRSRMREAIRILSGGPTGDPLVNELVRRTKDPDSAMRGLRESVLAFDQAAIFTIHGFCRRMLHEKAFESGSLFDTELIAEQETLVREIVDDFWRLHFYEESPLFVKYAIDRNVSMDNLLALISNRTAHPYLRIIPEVEIPDSLSQEREFKKYFHKLRESWPAMKAQVSDILLNDKGLKRSIYRRENIPAWIQAMDNYLASGDPNPVLFDKFEKFTSSEIEGAARKNHAPPFHPFFDLCETLRERHEDLEKVFEKRLLGLKTRLFEYVQQEVGIRKEGKNIQSFEDLLLKLYQALEGDGGDALLRSIRKRFRAALVDEFQDTDPIQYAIFRKLFGRGDSILFLIGDPKQAIYSFRGADIFAYMEASRETEPRYTLSDNWRSEPRLISAVNTIFANEDNPFLYEEVPFQPALPAERAQPEVLMTDGQSEPPFRLWLVDARNFSSPGKPITKTQARLLIPKIVASEISRLLHAGRANKALLGKRPLREEDIAVLVRRNNEAQLVQEALSDLRIPSVLYSTMNLFDSHEARELERVLAAIADPQNENAVRTALATDMTGLRGEKLASLEQDADHWEEWLVKFRTYHDEWERHGFMRMFRHFLLEEEVLTRLMSLPDGERRNTNILHLSELLHEIASEKKLHMTGLLKWLSEQRDPNSPRLNEHQLRLESDENAVKVVTIHKSKGLEYPVVFCPFAWDGSRVRNPKGPFMFHEEGERKLTLDLGSMEMDKSRVLAEKEQLAENLRLLYVALTRAKSCCYLIWGRFNEAETSALAYLLHPGPSLKGEDFLGALEKRFKGLSHERLINDLRKIQERANGCIRLSKISTEPGHQYPPLAEEKATLTCRKFSREIDRSWRISSFSSLVSGRHHAAEAADHDAIDPSEVSDQIGLEGSNERRETQDIFSFPKGTKAGTCLHDIFEHLDFSQRGDPSAHGLVAEKLQQYGFDHSWHETLCQMIQKVLSVPLEPGERDLLLCRVRNQDRINELEFYFPLRSIAPRRLGDIFLRHDGPNLSGAFREKVGRLEFLPVRGFMKGYIDMVFQFQGRFYLVDWKSNFLGSSYKDYDQDALRAAMEGAFYILQYHIYTLALDQYLRLRLPGYDYDTHFGGVYYIFLRGVDPEMGPAFGIYSDRPSGKLIEELGAELIGG